MAEDMSPRVRSFGDPVASTPNIDALSAEGVRFTSAFTTAGVCAPSRAAHITGMNQIAIGAQHMRTKSFGGSPYRAVPPPEVKAYPELLRAAGYYTFTNHKLDYQFSEFGAGTGPFTIWDQEGRQSGWEGRQQGQPFFGLVNFGSTHESQLFASNIEKNRNNGLETVTDPSTVVVPPYYPDTPLARQTIAQQYDNIHAMDKQIGQWLERLRVEGLLEETIVLWTTDHGDGLPRGKRELYDSGIHVPLVVRLPPRLQDPNRRPGSLDTRLVSFVDIGPSVLRWAGLPVPEWMHGIPILADDTLSREHIYAAKDRLDEHAFRERAVSGHRYKYLLNERAGEPGAKHLAYRDQMDLMQELWAQHESGDLGPAQRFWFEPRPPEELYDLQTDPWEVNNLASDPAYLEELDRLRVELRRWRQRIGDTGNESEAQMAERFWPGGERPSTVPPVVAREGRRIELKCETPGASIGYRIDDGPWLVYSQPFTVAAGTKLEAKAVRYGWAESAVATVTVD
jgi:arylsulfatase A-like enzyme